MYTKDNARKWGKAKSLTTALEIRYFNGQLHNDPQHKRLFKFQSSISFMWRTYPFQHFSLSILLSCSRVFSSLHLCMELV